MSRQHSRDEVLRAVRHNCKPDELRYGGHRSSEVGQKNQSLNRVSHAMAFFGPFADMGLLIQDSHIYGTNKKDLSRNPLETSPVMLNCGLPIPCNRQRHILLST